MLFKEHIPGQAPVFLYPNGIPNSKTAPAGYLERIENDRIFQVSQPVLLPFIPRKGNGAAVIICPGGSYGLLAMGHEGYDVARKFNEIGVTAFILKYRLPHDDIMTDKTIGPLQDAQTAVKIVRQGAKDWNIDPEKIGAIGFSAGGHLVSSLGTALVQHIENTGQINLKPNFMMLLYPVVTSGKYAHRPSIDNLLGIEPDEQALQRFSTELQVTPETPPAFIVHAQDDGPVPVQNSLLFYEALVNADVKTEMHLYPGGGHGFGLNNPTTKDNWFDRLVNWLEAGKWI